MAPRACKGDSRGRLAQGGPWLGTVGTAFSGDGLPAAARVGSVGCAARLSIASFMSDCMPERQVDGGHAASAAWLKCHGASAGAIESHYDVGNEFFSLWLDRALVYTCALWGGGDDPQALDAAQQRKIDYFARALGVGPGTHVLDIGCGWGGMLRRFCGSHGADAGTGITLSPQQAEYAAENPFPGVELRVGSWVDFEPDRRYDAIVSIESIEAFACRHLSRGDKVKIYRALFERCRSWLAPSRCFGLQAITYGTAGPDDFDSFIADSIFPESDLPRLSELVEAADGLFEVVSLRNDRTDYVLTLKCWLSRLKRQRLHARAHVGDQVVKRFEDYLRLSWHMFASGACDLHRIILRRIDRPRFFAVTQQNGRGT